MGAVGDRDGGIEGDRFRDFTLNRIDGKPVHPSELTKENVHFLVDPDLKVVNLYNLRWNAPPETAYPSTLVFNRDK